MAKSQKLINKLHRKEKLVKTHARGFDRYDKVDKSDEVLNKSHRAYELERKAERRMDRAFGNDTVAKEPSLQKRIVASTLARFDYGAGDFGMRLTMPAGMIAAAGIRPNDVIELLTGITKGQYYNVVAVTDSTHLRLEYLSIPAVQGQAEISKVRVVADVASSLNNKYWLLKSALNAVSYYVWYDVGGAGVDPAPGGTGIAVAIAANASAATVATATAAAVDFLAAFVSTASADMVTVTNAAVGATTDAAAGTSPFSIAVSQQGVSVFSSESSPVVRAQLSTTKKGAH